MQRILNDIKSGQYKQVYLLYGEEAYLRKQYRDKLREALLPADDTMNYKYYEGKDISVGEIIDLAETLPFFAERRLIVLENSGLFQSGGEQLGEYLKEPAATTFFIFVEKDIDKRSKLFKALQGKATIVEFQEQTPEILERWILGTLKRENKTITRQAVTLFLENTGNDMENIQKELEKLICYCLDKNSISEADVQAIAVHQVQGQIFEMINALSAGRQKQALDYYYDLLTLKEPPLRILSLLSRQFNNLMQVKEMTQKGYGQTQVAQALKWHPYVAKKNMELARTFKLSELREALEACAKAETDVKSGRMNDVMSVELLIVKYSSKRN